MGQAARLTLADLDSFGFEGRLGLYLDATLSIDPDEPLANVNRIIFEGFDDETSVEFPTLEISGSVDFPSMSLKIEGPVSAVIDVVGPDSVASFGGSFETVMDADAVPGFENKLLKRGDGSLVLSGSSASFQADVTVESGDLSVESDIALGSGNRIDVLSGASLILQSSATAPSSFRFDQSIGLGFSGAT